MRQTLGWPEDIDGRAVKTGLYEAYSQQKLSEEEARNEYARGDPVVWAGTGVGSISAIRSAVTIVKEVEEELAKER
jgi:hypothetical protein